DALGPPLRDPPHRLRRIPGAPAAARAPPARAASAARCGGGAVVGARAPPPLVREEAAAALVPPSYRGRYRRLGPSAGAVARRRRPRCLTECPRGGQRSAPRATAASAVPRRPATPPASPGPRPASAPPNRATAPEPAAGPGPTTAPAPPSRRGRGRSRRR